MSSDSTGLGGAPSPHLQAAVPQDFFTNAHNFTLGTFQVINSSSKPPELESGTPPGWKELLDISAPNALHNSYARFDPPKCDEDTRVDVIGKLMSWMQDRDSPTRLLCMTGAAGAGKSALQQTIAEHCAKRGILAASFFFSSTDHSRNHTKALIPTIAYQLGIVNPVLMKFIAAAMNNDQLIRTKSMDAQMEALIIQPLSQLRSGFDGDTLLLSLPYAILIDGLDECVGEKRQAELLEVIRKGFLDRPWIPFRIFIASRPEWAIRTALEPHGNVNAMSDHLRLSDMFDATADIRRTLRRRLREIGDRSSDPRARSPSWPSQEDVESLVSAASGQYIYVDAILRYVADRYCSPVERLQIVLTWRPSAEQFTHPFAALDLLYTNILVTAKNAYESADINAKRNFLVLFNAYRMHMERDLQYVHTVFRRPPIFQTHDRLLGLEIGGCAVLISDLHSLVAVEIDMKVDWGYERFRYYHKSFQDFLDSEARSGSLFVGIETVNDYIAGVQLRYISSVPLSVLETPTIFTQEGKVHKHAFSLHECAWCLAVLPVILKEAQPRPDLIQALLHFTEAGGWARIGQWFLVKDRDTREVATNPTSWVRALRHLLNVIQDEILIDATRELFRVLTEDHAWNRWQIEGQTREIEPTAARGGSDSNLDHQSHGVWGPLHCCPESYDD